MSKRALHFRAMIAATFVGSVVATSGIAALLHLHV
jgi:hypothetical protein